jgi:plasmid stability protein
MANLSVRKLDDGIYNQLRYQAKDHGVSIEEEVRQIIYQAVVPKETISSIFKKNFGKKNGINLEPFMQEKRPHEPLDLKK